ncbi:RHS repeat domain-containing protein [Chitiniphilus shinanonensis]|uniref:RHS repeat domain-containing protein n=1 Tax=Chitiniphilus shinanonensis TaxID=553088 RepID=UPI00303AF201
MPGATDQNTQWFTGKPCEDKIGLSYYGAWWYDPTLGRFMAMDPVDWVEESPVHSFNRYAYANNNPLRYIDPDGRFAAGTAEQALEPHAAMLGATGQSCSACVGGAFDATVAEWERGGLQDVYPEALLIAPMRFYFSMKNLFEGDIFSTAAKKVPEGWKTSPNKKGKGMRFKDPNKREMAYALTRAIQRILNLLRKRTMSL